MSRYIDADAMIARAFQDSERLYLESVARHTPSIDIVRCKECKFSEVWESTAGNELYCEKQRVCPYDWGAIMTFYVKADGFCSYGKRREHE